MTRSRGSITVESVLLVPVLFMLLFFVMAAGRLAEARVSVRAAADVAARAGSLVSRSRVESTVDASAYSTLGQRGVCSRVDAASTLRAERGFKFVDVLVSCRLSLDGATGFLVGGRTLTASSREVIDVFTYR